MVDYISILHEVHCDCLHIIFFLSQFRNWNLYQAVNNCELFFQVIRTYIFFWLKYEFEPNTPKLEFSYVVTL